MRRLLVGTAIGGAVAALVAWRRAGIAAVRGLVARVQPRRGADLGELTKEELYERAQAADIPGRSSMSKEELIAALRSADRDGS